jgi:hypothetical protein
MKAGRFVVKWPHAKDHPILVVLPQKLMVES